MRKLREQTGVALVTVLLVGASLTVITTAASFAAIQDMRQGTDDRTASQALAFAEAGVDAFIKYVKSGLVNYAQLNQAGCNGNPPLAIPTGDVGNGTFAVSLTVYDPNASGASQYPPAACAGRSASPHPGQGADMTYFVITATGCSNDTSPCAPNATSVVRQVIALRPVGIPIGLYAHAFDPKAHPAYESISAISETIFTDRQKDNFTGLDSYYLYGDFFPDVNGSAGVHGVSPSAHIPAAVHAGAIIYTQKSSKPEFSAGPKNCSYSNSLWDSDGTGGGVGSITSDCAGDTNGAYPTYSKFNLASVADKINPNISEQDYQVLRQAAQQNGVYCSLPGAGQPGTGSCIKQGLPAGSTDVNALRDAVLNAGTNQFIVFVDYAGGTPSQNVLPWSGSVWGCDQADPDNTKSVVVVVRNGGIEEVGSGGDMINGAFIVDGNFTADGQITFNGTMVVRGTVSFGSSSELMQLTNCWVNNTPGPFFSIVPGHWSQVDR